MDLARHILMGGVVSEQSHGKLVDLARAVLRGWRLEEELAVVPAAPEVPIADDAVERARLLLQMHAALRLLFPEDAALREDWVRIRNRSLEGNRPLDLMLTGELNQMRRCAFLLVGQTLA